MTHPAEVVDRAAELLAEGLSQAEVARRTGVSRAVIRDWVSAGPEAVAERRRTLPSLHPPGSCPWVPRMADVGPQYAYLLGLYLGDGVISSARRDVFKLRLYLHSDGSRFLNWSKGRPYPRYMFANKSADIHSIFGRACDVLGIEHRPANAKNISIARRESVELMDSFVGPKS